MEKASLPGQLVHFTKGLGGTTKRMEREKFYTKMAALTKEGGKMTNVMEKAL
jgi:hypothetical protein